MKIPQVILLVGPDWVSAGGAMVAAVVGLVTLLLIWIELRHLRLQIRAGSTDNIYNQMIEIDRFFAERPELKLYFYCGKDPVDLTEIDREQLNSIAEMLVDYFDNVYQQRHCLGDSTFNGKGAYMREIYSKSPVLRAYLEPIVEWYPEEFMEYLRQPPPRAKVRVDDGRHR